MKKHNILALAAAALALMAAGPASAGSVFAVGNGVGNSVKQSEGQVRWVRGISSGGLLDADSTRISILDAAAAADHADTTDWVDFGKYDLDQTYTGQPVAWFQVNKQPTASADSVGYIVQTTNDLSLAAAASTATYASTTIAYFTTVASVGLVGNALVPAPTSSVTPAKYARLIIYNADTSATDAGRTYYTVTPMVFGSKK